MDARAPRRIFFRFGRKRKTILLVALICLAILTMILHKKEKDIRRYLKRSHPRLPVKNIYDELQIKEMVKNQKCKIPKMDPFHPEILPYLSPPKYDGCRLKKYGVVENGILYLKVRNVVTVSLYYIRRVNDFRINLSKRISILDHGDIDKYGKECWKHCEKSGYCPSFCGTGGFCCKKGHGGCPDNLVVTTDYHGCVYEKSTPRVKRNEECWERCNNKGGSCPSFCGKGGYCCRIGYDDCPKNLTVPTDYHSCVYDASIVQDKLYEECYTHCGKKGGYCPSFCGKGGFCCRKGYADCPKTLQVITDYHGCVYNKSMMMTQVKPYKECWTACGKKGGECPSFCGKGGYCCRKGYSGCPKNLTIVTDYHGCVYGQSMLRDVNIEYSIKEEFFKLEINFVNELHVEYHFGFLNTQEDKERTDLNNQLNIIMVMYDSTSYSHMQRSLKKTYKFLKEHPRNVFMEGQTIVGDGTTSQMCAILTGISEGELPEARRGFPNSVVVDRWPFIFKEMDKLNYKTVFSEEEPFFASFNYRLHGFDKLPTTHYLRPLWYGMNHLLHEKGTSCAHRFHFEYIKKFFNAYRRSNKFIMAFNMINHNTGNAFENADDDTLNFYKHILRSEFANNTVIILGGDHGLRTSGYRSSLHGKMEERLPLLSITLPPSFESYPNVMRNLRRNAHLMTSHFDTYATLRHLLTFPTLNESDTGKYGKSFFTDISKFNRTCGDAGVDMHWCTCLNYEPVNTTSDAYVLSLVTKVINYMNDLNQNYTKDMCSILKLRKLIRAGRRTPNAAVNQFVGTRTDKGGCDSCQPQFDKTVKFSRYQYEIIFSVSPSGGEYETSGEVFREKNGGVRITYNTDISRTNLYGNQPNCIAEQFPHLRKYCYCRTPT